MKHTDGIPFDGFGQVIEMLHKADPSFREKIIRSIAEKDPHLAQRLLQATNQSLKSTKDAVERSERRLAESRRSVLTRSYGE